MSMRWNCSVKYQRDGIVVSRYCCMMTQHTSQGWGSQDISHGAFPQSPSLSWIDTNPMSGNTLGFFFSWKVRLLMSNVPVSLCLGISITIEKVIRFIYWEKTLNFWKHCHNQSDKKITLNLKIKGKKKPGENCLRQWVCLHVTVGKWSDCVTETQNMCRDGSGVMF